MTAAAHISCNFPFQTGDQIFLKAANQLYLSVIERGGSTHSKQQKRTLMFIVK